MPRATIGRSTRSRLAQLEARRAAGLAEQASGPAYTLADWQREQAEHAGESPEEWLERIVKTVDRFPEASRPGMLRVWKQAAELERWMIDQGEL